MQTLKVAVVGTGRVAEHSYLPCLSQEPGVELAYYNRTPVLRLPRKVTHCPLCGICFDEERKV